LEAFAGFRASAAFSAAVPEWGYVGLFSMGGAPWNSPVGGVEPGGVLTVENRRHDETGKRQEIRTARQRLRII